MLPSCLGLRSPRARLGRSREMIKRRLAPDPRRAILRPSPRQPAGVPSAETWPSPPIQRQEEGPNRAAFERGACGERSGSAGQACSGTDGHRDRSVANLGGPTGRRELGAGRGQDRERADEIGPPASNAAPVRAPTLAWARRSSSAGGSMSAVDYYSGDHSRDRSTDRSRERGRGGAQPPLRMAL